ncbi:hypothetical protein [Companilactobacillus sp. FL22-1]
MKGMTPREYREHALVA